jgi:hypothetical protein
MGLHDDIKKRIEDDAKDGKRVFALAQQQPFPFNKNLRLVYDHDTERDDLEELCRFGETVGMTSFDVRLWYANGPECQDRPGVLATFHPVVHKRDDGWKWIIETAIALAKELERWIWVTIGEDRWVRIMLGTDPTKERRRGEDDDETSPLFVNGEYQNDQYITTFSPTGDEHFVGCS